MISNRSIYQRTEILEPVNSLGNSTAPAYIDLRQRIEEYDPEDRVLQIAGMRTWGEIGYRFLQDATGWQVIADLSDIIDPLEELKDGIVLRVPTIDRYLFELLPGSGV